MSLRLSSLSTRLNSHWPLLCEALRLSPRESQVLRGLLDGQSESEVAEIISISAHTVHAHVERMYRKLRVNSRTELLLYVFRTYVELCDGRNDAKDGMSQERQPPPDST